MADFAPYQDVPPERERALSPQRNVRSPTGTLSPRPERNIGTVAVHSPVLSPQQAGAGSFFPANGGGWGNEEDVEQGRGRTTGFGGGSGREDVDLFETRLGIRMDWEACLAYLALPPVGPVLLLIVEHKSDYVRYVVSQVIEIGTLNWTARRANG
jgi:hypothetical protein